MATATSLLITAASCSLSMAAESPAQSECLTRTQAEQTWPHSHLYWHTERQATTMPVNYQVMERDGGTVWVKPPAEVATYYPSLMKGQKPKPELLTPKPVFDWPLLIHIDTPNRFAPWDRRISGIMK